MRSDAGPEPPGLALEGTSGLAASAVQVCRLILPNVQLRMLCLRATLATKAEEGPSRLALWTRPPFATSAGIGITLRRVSSWRSLGTRAG
ncbi:hypothetical protein EDB86DRAFT_3103640 [Lactarius hatsudake]|nr:hypothetical protein EDB86DRAFT_3103640 [Lactarius hatsudake]